MSICRLHDVSKGYGDGETHVWALRHLSLTIEAGEFTVLAGPSGSGKTTALNLIGCLDTPTEGEVYVEDKATAALSSPQLAALRADRIGFIFQSFNLIPVLSALENVELSLQLAGRTGNNRDLARQALDEVGLGSLLHRRPNQLSGGQQQRIAIARALVKQPALVIADEPTANLDSHTGAAVVDLMREMNESRGITFLFSTHDSMVIKHATRVVRLKDGQLDSDEHQQAPTGPVNPNSRDGAVP